MNTKPKILIVGPGFPYRNGPALYLAHLCNELKSEFDVTLVNYSMLYPSFLFPGKTQYEESTQQIISYPNKRMVSSLNPLTWLKTARYINKQNPDLVVFDWWHPFFGPCHSGIIALLKKRLRKKILYITENVISHEANTIDKTLTKLALRNAACFLALSESVKNHLNTLFSKKIFRSELPIYDFYKNKELINDGTKSKFGFKEDDIVFLFFGLVRKYKGLDLLIEAFANLAKSNDHLKLLVVGEFYEPSEPYIELIEKYGIAEKIVIENRYVPNEEVADFFLASEVTVLPYRSATQSGVLNVAYGFLKPAIVTNVGELGSLVETGETGVVAATPTVESLEDAMKQFLSLYSSNKRFDLAIEKYIAEKSNFKQVNKVFAEIVQYTASL